MRLENDGLRLHRVFRRLLCSPPPGEDADDDDADAEDEDEDEEEEGEDDAAFSAWMTDIQVLRRFSAASAISAMACEPSFATTFPTPAPLIAAMLTDSRLNFRRQLSTRSTCLLSAGTVPSSGIARVAISMCFFKCSRRRTFSICAALSRMAKGEGEEDEDEDEEADEEEEEEEKEEEEEDEDEEEDEEDEEEDEEDEEEDDADNDDDDEDIDEN